MDLVDTQRQLIATLLFKVAIISGIAAVLVRSSRFKQLVYAECWNLRQTLELAAFIGLPVAIGMMMRLQFRLAVPDLGLEGALLAGVLGGWVAGLAAGLIAAVPAILGPDREFLYPPVLALAGCVAGLVRGVAPATEHIWHFSPFVDMNILRWYQRRFGKPRGGWQLLFFLTIGAVEGYTMILARFFPGTIHALHSSSKVMLTAIIGAGIVSLAIPIKIWNNTRNEIKLEEQNRLLAEARLMALTNQINPHFLFNTLNSISSLIRTNPEMARTLIQKLSGILRRLLRRGEALTSLREELDFLDDYLSIEHVRFGDKVRVEKEIDEGALDALVPSMLLQPLVENAIKHGIGPKVEGGAIRIRGVREDGRVRIEIRDDGLGIPLDRMEQIHELGVGLGNAQERIKVLYGDDYVFSVQSEEGQGTVIVIVLPDPPRS